MTMKKFKLIKKIFAIFIVLSLITLPIDTVLAESDYTFEFEITNFTEPKAGAKPKFDYNMDFNINDLEGDLSFFELEYWYEFDYDYSTLLKKMNDMEGFFDFNNLKAESTKTISNPEYDYYNNSLEKFEVNHTYMAVFEGKYSPKIIVDGYFEPAPEPIASAFGSNVVNAANYGEPTITAMVNGSNDNVKCLIETPLRLDSLGTSGRRYVENQPYHFAIVAIYDLHIPQEEIKATVNWINAEDKDIPESFVLKLMNGSTVVKEQVLTKDNAVDGDTWEYDFGEYPTLDENGNKINYTLAYSESKDGDLKFFESKQEGFTINNKYIAPEISSKVKMKSIVDREINNIKYKIDYNASIKKYSGDADVLITAILPFAVDENKSNLDGGVYDSKTRSITWTETIKDIEKVYDYSTTKNIDLYATAVLPYSIETKTVGEVTLSDAGGFSKSAEAIDSVEVGTGNPKTGDINIAKNFSIALIGLGTILIVIQIKRKYSTRKNNVLF